MRISAFVITKDSARTLDRCPDSPDWASEVVVLDDFITDAGEEICLRRRSQWSGIQFHERFLPAGTVGKVGGEENG